MLLKEVVDKMTGLTEVELNTLIDFAFLRKFSLQEKRERHIYGFSFQFTEKYKENALHKPCVNKLSYNKSTNAIERDHICSDIIAKTDGIEAVTVRFHLKPGEVAEREMIKHQEEDRTEVVYVYYTADRKGNLILIAHNEDQKNLNRMEKYLKGEITLDNLLQG